MRTDDRLTLSTELPDVARPDAGVILVSSWYAGTPERQRAMADATVADWREGPPPEGFLSLSCFLSGDGETVLAYSQWTSDDAHREFAATAPRAPRGIDLREPVRYRLYRSLASGDQTPGCVITGTFDVDGPERQRHIADALIDWSARAGPLPGAVSAHFHLSLDGSRVINYAEWTSLEDHDAAVAGADLDEAYRISAETPGVRATRGRMYRPYAHLAP